MKTEQYMSVMKLHKMLTLWVCLRRKKGGGGKIKQNNMPLPNRFKISLEGGEREREGGDIYGERENHCDAALSINP